MALLQKFAQIRLVVLDVDGVLTNGSLLVMPGGEMLRTMNVYDGYAMQLAIKRGLQIIVVTGGDSEAVRARLQKLGIENVHTKCLDKAALVASVLQEQQISWEHVAVLGDDIPDLTCMQHAGLACCPANAVKEIKDVSHYISNTGGGNGFVREVLEKILKLQHKWDDDTHTPSA